ncbi:EthD domain-containing protein (plasmid) [Sphingobium limneticum]|jgi:hypothetical protein|uniref:EthD domain-containing protein n=1 Tax=Nitrobacter sp. TaxID=29420 RepID=UPI00065C9ED7|nr:EthD domain-containing protein [Nitrobacter sp.]
MIKAVGLLKRKEGMSFEEFVSYYKDKHSKLGERVMRSCGAVRYARRFIVPVSDPYQGVAPQSEYDVITEFWFNDKASFEKVFSLVGNELRDEFVEDEEKFLDRSASKLMLVVEEDESVL